MRYVLFTAVFLVVAAVSAGAYFWSPHAVVRITTGPVGGGAERFVNAFVSVMRTLHPRVTFQPVPVADLTESSKAMEAGKVDLAIVRTDVSPPVNGQTIAILRRDAVGIILPAKSAIDAVAGLRGKTIGIIAGPLQSENEKVLDTILAYYNLPGAMVHRSVLPIAALSAGIRGKTIAAVLAVGPVGPGELIDAVAMVSKASGGAATLLAFDDADAFSARNPGFESLDIPSGALRAKPETPDDTLTTLALTYRLVAPERMLNVVAGAIGQAIFTAKTRLLTATPSAAYIEAPDTDAKSPILPIHPGVSAYLTNGEQSFFDEFQTYFYAVGIGLSLLISIGTMVTAYLSRKSSAAETAALAQLIKIADEARTAEEARLDELDEALHRTLTTVIHGRATAVSLPTAALAASHARGALSVRRTSLAGLRHGK
ncbi:MAG: C4-dicarboxylate transporter substrate-binding protein [Hyphomicrobiales bacterium]|nr:C4-dicarboxylate transporter substrate-binding protein [Hyphomicrobiales bacterium]